MIIVPMIPETSPAKYHFNAVPMPLGGFSLTSLTSCLASASRVTMPLSCSP